MCDKLYDKFALLLQGMIVVYLVLNSLVYMF